MKISKEKIQEIERYSWTSRSGVHLGTLIAQELLRVYKMYLNKDYFLELAKQIEGLPPVLLNEIEIEGFAKVYIKLERQRDDYLEAAYRNSTRVQKLEKVLEQMSTALESITKNWPEERDGMDDEGPRPAGLIQCREAMKNYNEHLK